MMDNQIINAYLLGDKVKEISKKYFYSQTTIYRILKKNNIKLRSDVGGSIPINPISKDRLQHMLLHYNRNEISNLLNISVPTLKKWLDVYNIKIKHYTDDEFIKLYYKHYYNTDNNLYLFCFVIERSYEYIRKKQIKLNLPRKDKRTWFKKINDRDVKIKGEIICLQSTNEQS